MATPQVAIRAIQFRLGLRDRDSRSQLTQDVVEVVAAIVQDERRGLHRQPDAFANIGAHRFRKAKGGRHDADDGASLVIHPDGLAHDGRIGMECLAPQPFREQDHLGSVRSALLRLVKVRPISGCTPSMEKRFGLTLGDMTEAGASAPDGTLPLPARRQRIPLDHAYVFRIDRDLGEVRRGLVADIPVVEPRCGPRPCAASAGLMITEHVRASA